MRGSWKKKLMMAVMNRYFLVLLNFLLAAIIASIVIELTILLRTPQNDSKEMIEMCNGIAIILYGYGVALESRGPLMNHLNLYPDYLTRYESEFDSLCHKYGIFFLLLALAQEILVHLITIPNRAINTEGKEGYIFSICFAILIIVAYLLMYFSVILVQTARTAKMRDT
jgi:uncharacterized Tic20 family protein